MKLPALTLPVIVLCFLIFSPLVDAQRQRKFSVPEISRGIRQQLTLPVGGTGAGEAPPASIALWVNEPPAGSPIRGTVFLLHGFLANHYQVANAGESLRKSGYRAVLIDTRGFGQSTGTHYTFGVADALDLSQIVDALQRQKLCGRTVGVYGTSMGAATAILFAAHDARVTAVVAVAPFASIRQEVPMFSRNLLGELGGYLTDGAINSIANVVSEVAGLNLDDAKPIDAIGRTQAQILLIHGDADTIIPPEASEKLHRAARENSELLIIRNQGHLDLCFDVPGRLQSPTRNWFDAHLAQPAPR